MVQYHCTAVKKWTCVHVYRPWPFKMELNDLRLSPWRLHCTAITCYSRIFSSFHERPPHIQKQILIKCSSDSQETKCSLNPADGTISFYWKDSKDGRFKVSAWQYICSLFINPIIPLIQWSTHDLSVTHLSMLSLYSHWSFSLTLNNLFDVQFFFFVHGLPTIPTAVLFLSLSLGWKRKIKPTTPLWSQI